MTFQQVEIVRNWRCDFRCRKSELRQIATGNQEGQIKTAWGPMGQRKRQNSSQLSNFNGWANKKDILGKVTKIWDPLGLVSPMTLSGKCSTEMPMIPRSCGIAPYKMSKKSWRVFPTRNVYDRLGSTVALHWICGSGEYKQFVGNQVRKIQEKQINWKHVPTEQNPEDVGSWGGDVS